MRIGVTRSGTEIKYKPNQTPEEFKVDVGELTDDDKFDTYCMFQCLISWSRQKHGEMSDDYYWWLDRFNFLDKVVRETIRPRCASKLGLGTSYAEQQFGIKMVDHFWRVF